MTDDPFLWRPSTDTPTIDLIVAEAKQSSRSDVGFINAVGELALQRFWIPDPQYATPHRLDRKLVDEGVYFNPSLTDE